MFRATVLILAQAIRCHFLSHRGRDCWIHGKKMQEPQSKLFEFLHNFLLSIPRCVWILPLRIWKFAKTTNWRARKLACWKSAVIVL